MCFSLTTNLELDTAKMHTLPLDIPEMLWPLTRVCSHPSGQVIQRLPLMHLTEKCLFLIETTSFSDKGMFLLELSTKGIRGFMRTSIF